MVDAEQLAQRFEAARPRLHRIAQRILGSPIESDDALQEGWLRVSRADTTGIENLDGWLTTVVARACLDALKRRESRREDLTADDTRRNDETLELGARPEDEAIRADSIGVALRVLLDALRPVERVAFVLHDMFDVPFDDVAAIVGRTPEATRQLTSRARARVRGAAEGRDTVTQRHDELVRAFLAASRLGNFSTLLALLDPGATLRMDAAAIAMSAAANPGADQPDLGAKGADAVARTFSGRARVALAAFIDGRPGALFVHDDAIRVIFRFTIEDDCISAIDLIADPAAIAGSVIER